MLFLHRSPFQRSFGCSFSFEKEVYDLRPNGTWLPGHRTWLRAGARSRKMVESSAEKTIEITMRRSRGLGWSRGCNGGDLDHSRAVWDLLDAVRRWSLPAPALVPRMLACEAALRWLAIL